MKTCIRFQGMMAEALYEELRRSERNLLDEHLSVCSACAQEFNSLSSVMNRLDQRRHPEMSDQFWADFTPGIMDKIDATERTGTRSGIQSGSHWFWDKLNLWRDFKIAPRLLLYPAAALLLIVSGISIGRYLSGPTDGKLRNDNVAAVADVGPEMTEHFENLRPMLTDYSNYTPSESFDQEGGKVTVNRKIVKQLMVQNYLLKKAVNRSGDASLKQLMDDLELILLELSNAGSGEEQKQTMEAVRGLLDRNDVLFKMKVYGKHRSGSAQM